MWLRINCHCPQCTTTVSNQRSFSPWHYNPDLNSKPSPDFLFGHSSKEPFSSQTFEVTRCWDSPTSEKDEGMLDVEFQDGRDGSQHVGKVPKELLVKMYKETTFAKQIRYKKGTSKGTPNQYQYCMSYDNMSLFTQRCIRHGQDFNLDLHLLKKT